MDTDGFNRRHAETFPARTFRPGRLTVPAIAPLEQDVSASTREHVEIFTRAWLQWNDLHAKPHERWPISYRLDTCQIWEADPDRRKLGLHIDIDMTDPDQPWAIRLGGYTLERHRYLHRAVAELCTRAGNTIMWAQWHVGEVGYPCHSDCDC